LIHSLATEDDARTTAKCFELCLYDDAVIIDFDV